ncbi:hypothetical protein AB1I63_00280 [Streptococcus pneumoniae]
MLVQLLVLFILGAACLLFATVLTAFKLVRRVLFVIGGLLFSLPFLACAYFLWVILTQAR